MQHLQPDILLYAVPYIDVSITGPMKKYRI